MSEGGTTEASEYAFRVECGGCGTLVNVPHSLVENLLLRGVYRCPQCKARQQISVDKTTKDSLVLAAQQHLQRQQQQQEEEQRALAAQGQQVLFHPGHHSENPAARHNFQHSTFVSPLKERRNQQQMLKQRAAAARGSSQPVLRLDQHTFGDPLEGKRRPSAQQPHSVSGSMNGKQMLHRMAALDKQYTPFSRAAPFQVQVQGSGNSDTEDGRDDIVEEELDMAGIEVYEDYKPSKLNLDGVSEEKLKHPDPVQETTALATVSPPDITYKPSARLKELAANGQLSGLQMESIVYACQRHGLHLPDGSRAGFFIGDGAGVGKGRTIAGMILENWLAGRRQHLWVSVGADLLLDAGRDMADVGAGDIDLHALNKQPYGRLGDPSKKEDKQVRDGVVFLTYATLVSGSNEFAKGRKGQKQPAQAGPASRAKLAGPAIRTRLEQLVEWCGRDFDGLIIFDECHKAKNLMPDSGAEPTRTGRAVQELQKQLPQARVVYCSATGAAEPRNMAYMVRLGLWGRGNTSFQDVFAFLDALESRSVSMGVLEVVAMELKARGMYVCRTLSYAGAEFSFVSAELEPDQKAQYARSCEILLRVWIEFNKAMQVAKRWERGREREMSESGNSGSGAAVGGASGGGGGSGKGKGFMKVSRQYWATHQRFFRAVCMAVKVPVLCRMAREAVACGCSVVIALQSTGEARTVDIVAERGDVLDDFVSGPKEMLLKLVEEWYPLPPLGRPAGGSEASTSTQADSENAVARSRTTAGSSGVGDARADTLGGPANSIKRGNRPASEPPSTSGRTALCQEPPKPGLAPSPTLQNPWCAGDAGVLDLTGEAFGRSGKEPSSPEPSGFKVEDARDPECMIVGEHAGPWGAAAPNPKRPRVEGSPTPQDLPEELARAYRQALKRKQQLKEEIQGIAMPKNPLDDIIDQLGGPLHVAEMTGRRSRLVRQSNGTVRLETRHAHACIATAPGSGTENSGNAGGSGTAGVASSAGPSSSSSAASPPLEMINVHEREAFLDGRKHYAIISEAASAGISLHADRRSKAKDRRRVHITLELPWSADRALQQLGRSHRANQQSAPVYQLLYTNLGGERRFASAVARRIEQMGALTQGSRKAQGRFAFAEFSEYESALGKEALGELYSAVLENSSLLHEVPPPMCVPDASPQGRGRRRMTPPEFARRARLLLMRMHIFRPHSSLSWDTVEALLRDDADGPDPSEGVIEKTDRKDVQRFLNRLLGLAPDDQEMLFDYFDMLLKEAILRSKRKGTYDEGISQITASRIWQMPGSPRAVFQDASSSAETLYYHMQGDRGVSWEQGQSRLQSHLDSLRTAGNLSSSSSAAAASSAAVSSSGWYRSRLNNMGGRPLVLLALQLPDVKPAKFRIIRPITGPSSRPVKQEDLRAKYVQVGAEDCEALWHNSFQRGMHEEQGGRLFHLHLLAGMLLPVWTLVQQVCSSSSRPRDQKVSVVKVATTDDDPPLRVVGIRIQDHLIDKVLSDIHDLELRNEQSRLGQADAPPAEVSAPSFAQAPRPASSPGSLLDIHSSMNPVTAAVPHARAPGSPNVL